MNIYYAKKTEFIWREDDKISIYVLLPKRSKNETILKIVSSKILTINKYTLGYLYDNVESIRPTEHNEESKIFVVRYPKDLCLRKNNNVGFFDNFNLYYCIMDPNSIYLKVNSKYLNKYINEVYFTEEEVVEEIDKKEIYNIIINKNSKEDLLADIKTCYEEIEDNYDSEIMLNLIEFCSYYFKNNIYIEYKNVMEKFRNSININ